MNCQMLFHIEAQYKDEVPGTWNPEETKRKQQNLATHRPRNKKRVEWLAFLYLDSCVVDVGNMTTVENNALGQIT